MDGAMPADDPILLRTVERFLTHEARLIDDRRFEDWLALFDPEGRYWVPMAWQQESATEHVSIIYEDVGLLKMRVTRLLDPRTASQQPPSRTCHQVTNTEIEQVGPNDGDLRARSSFTMVEYRRDDQRLFAGFVRHHLRRTGDGLRILLKRVDLLNCDCDGGHLRMGPPL